MKTYKKPGLLKPGDQISIVAPAGVVEQGYIEKAVHLFESWGLKVKTGQNLFVRNNQFAGSDKQRTADLQNALDDEDIKAVICARGGYGTLRIIDKINWNKFVNNPKWLVGFSDITVLHSRIHHLGIQSIHAAMPVNFEKLSLTSKTIELLGETLFQGRLKYEFSSGKSNIKGTEIAPVTGGNLSLLYALGSTRYMPDLEGKILFFEDVGEQYYHLDRMLQALRLSGKMDKLSGLIVGGLTDMQDGKHSFGKTPHEIISDIVAGYDFPVIFDFPAGHQLENYPLIFGSETAMEVKSDKYILNFR